MQVTVGYEIRRGLIITWRGRGRGGRKAAKEIVNIYV